MTILVTGGAGFIGSHTCAELLGKGEDVVVVDDFSAGSPAALDAAVRVAGGQRAGGQRAGGQRAGGQRAGGQLTAHRVDLRDRDALDRAFAEQPIDAVIHFAAKKAVGESVQVPLDYFDVNIGGTVSLLAAMVRHGVARLVFSSSCSVYGDQYTEPITEDDPPAPANPYARSKLVCEQVLADVCRRYDDMRVTALRYFNPAGAHESGELGEAPAGEPGNLMPYLVQVAAGHRGELRVFGGDYPTADGTAVRDYLHVTDVAQAHLTALRHLGDRPGMRVVNLGTGAGTSVLQLVRTFQHACGVRVRYRVVGRRRGDVASLVADTGRARRELGWRATRGVTEMCRDAWRFQQRHPAGYRRRGAAGHTGGWAP